MSSRDINDLHPKAADLCRTFIEECKKNGIDVIITSTVRTMKEQNDLYAQGRTKPGPKVTNAKAGQSFHNYRIAFDFCPIVNGKAAWNDTKLFERCGEIAESIGLEWAGRWKSFKELAHCQMSGYTLAELKAGKAVA